MLFFRKEVLKKDILEILEKHFTCILQDVFNLKYQQPVFRLDLE
jgi:hypothetical protein